MTTRAELKEQVKLLEQLEQLEQLLELPRSIEVAGSYSKKSFDITGVYTGEPTLNSQLNAIARKHFRQMIIEQIKLVKSKLTIELTDKDK